ncbi:MAG TPA: DUF2207 domain-containing protein [Actinomycetota bacterium]
MGRLLAGAAVVLSLWPALPAQAKDYSFPEVRIEATILPDGSLDLVEDRTYAFDGDFSFAFLTIDDHDRSLIEDFTVTRDGQPLPVEEGFSDRGGFKGTWRFDAHDEDITFSISYRARCAVNVFADGAHLLWQFVGRGWEKRTDHLLVTLHVPGRAADPPPRPEAPCGPFGVPPVAEIPDPGPVDPLERGDVRAWGHGPLGGQVAFRDAQTVTFEIRNLQPFTFVEGSVLMPAASVPLAYQLPQERAAEILAQEGRLADEANAARLRYRAGQRLATRLLVLVPLLLLGLVLLARWRDRVPGAPRHLELPPDDTHPAELAHVWSVLAKKPTVERAYRTQLLHLAQQGAIQLEAVGRVTEPQDFTIRRKKEPGAALDKEFMDFLFPDGTEPDSVKMKSLKAAGKRADELREWSTLLTDKTKGGLTRLLTLGTRFESWLLFAVAAGAVAWLVSTEAITVLETLLMASVGLAAGLILRLLPFVFRHPVLGLIGAAFVALFSLPIVLPLFFVIRDGGGMVVTDAHRAVAVIPALWVAALRFVPERLPDDLRERVAGWNAFRRYLREFSSLPDAPAAGIVIWERYMVYATALGVAKEVEAQIRALIPPAELGPPFEGAPAGLDGLSTFHGFSTTPISARSYTEFVSGSSGGSSWSSGSGSFSSGGGGGGGFSGGGGGGGGGTGGGAG